MSNNGVKLDLCNYDNIVTNTRIALTSLYIVARFASEMLEVYEILRFMNKPSVFCSFNMRVAVCRTTTDGVYSSCRFAAK